MDLHRLALLRDLRRLGTVTAVARAAHVTPTAVSQQLKKLEREAGAALVRRVGRGLELTDAGVVLCDASDHVEVALARVQATWDSWRGEVGGTVRLSIFPTAAQGLLPGLLDRLAAHPGLALEVVEADLHGDEYAVHTDRVDVVVGHRAGVDGRWDPEAWARRGVHVVPLVDEPLDVALPPDHPLLASGDLVAVQPGQLADESWVGVPEAWPFDRALEDWFAAAGLRPRIGLRFTDLRAQEALVVGGHGPALLPRFATDDRDGARLRLVPTAGLTQYRHVAALARSDRAERVAVRVVLEALRAQGRVYAGA
ncbi:LysR family transcriptional regulator [Nocardioides sp. KIGAM211]|uniref:LysR family transcriptional regulator n=1 Tax=Nocardioides luti TaxID=2761101 RepID=A0A7X0RKI4_9ACTN|nr:LysR family transcriptional regulator [Nocardioides luti]MBB6629860.1 LysR family transcriptional regulator [Nocardioides luti]